MAGSGGSIFLKFWRWWTAALAAALPTPIRNIFRTQAHNLTVDFDSVGGVCTIVPRSDNDGAGSGSVRVKQGPATLWLPNERVLKTSVSLPISAGESVREVLASEMARHTPFTAGDVYFDFAVAGLDTSGERISIDLLVARRLDIDLAVRQAVDQGYSPVRVAQNDNGVVAEGGYGLNLLPSEARIYPSRAGARAVSFAAVAAVVSAMIWFGVWQDHNQQVLAASEAKVQVLRQKAGSVQAANLNGETLVTALNAIVTDKRDQPSVVELLNELSRLLPDDAWLTDFKLSDGQIVVDGYAVDPANVLNLLEASPIFAAANFTAPVQMDAQVKKEKFQLKARVIRRRTQP